MALNEKHIAIRRHDYARREDKRRLKIAIIFTTVIFLAELAGGFLSGSVALVADAWHMFVDSLSLILSYIALRLADRPVNDKFTYGLHRIEILAALINGVILLFVCAYIVYQGIQRFLHPVRIDVPLMVGVATIGITANIVSALLLRHSLNLNVRSAFLHVLGDLFSSIGIIVAGVAMLAWDILWLDPALSIVIAGIVLISAYRLTREAVGVLMEAVPEGVDISGIRRRLLRLPYVDEVHDLHVWTITSGLLALSCHVVLSNANETSQDDALLELSDVLKEEFEIHHSTIQLESPLYRYGNNQCKSC